MGRDSVPVGVGVCLCVLSGNFGARRFALGKQVARIGSSYVPRPRCTSADLAQMVDVDCIKFLLVLFY